MGYGGNKAACLFELYLSGVKFYVMADHFLIHQSHKYEEEARREEVRDGCLYVAGSVPLNSTAAQVQQEVVCRFQGRSMSTVK